MPPSNDGSLYHLLTDPTAFSNEIKWVFVHPAWEKFNEWGRASPLLAECDDITAITREIANGFR